MFKKLAAVLFMGWLGWAYQAIHPPPPKICGFRGSPPVTAPRVKLSDGRHLAYKEHGVPKNIAEYKIVYIHGFDNCRHDAVIAQMSPDVLEDLRVYIVSLDRPGYGESDSDPNRTLKSLALDIEQLADQLGLGSKFYVVGFSMGGQLVWSCLKYIPHRLAGAVLLAPAINYWWPNLPSNLSKAAYDQILLQDRWALRITHYIPSLTYWWNTQTWFPIFGAIAPIPDVFSRQDLEIMSKFSLSEIKKHKAHVRQQGDYESLHRDMMITFGTWEFDPMDVENPFPNNEGSVHLWQGDEDKLVPVTLQRYIAQQLPWIHYHELAGSGHMFPLAPGFGDAIIKALVTGSKGKM